MIEFTLPDVGEGLTEAEVLTWHVRVGDVVKVNDTLVEIETAKSVVELPAPAAGTITAVHVDEGVTVGVGTVLVSIDTGSSYPTAVAPFADAAEPGERPLVLVGTGPSPVEPRRRKLSRRSAAMQLVAPVERVVGPPHTLGAARTKPPVRLLAKRLGVDLNSIAPTAGDLISRSDVEAAAAGEMPLSSDAAPAPHAARGRHETRIPIKGVRRATAAAMTRSAFTAPHVTEWVTVDVTRTMEMVRRLKADRQWSDVRLTPLVFVARAVLLAVRRYPEINARWEEDAQEIVISHHVNLGIATATPRGLMVPNIKHSDALDLRGLADAVGHLVETARSGRASLEDMSNGTFTITNIGALGVDAGTPILNPGEAAILAFGAVRKMPWVVDDRIEPREITQLAMSFDHRLIDGELGSNVLAEVGRLLEDPGHAFLYV